VSSGWLASVFASPDRMEACVDAPAQRGEKYRSWTFVVAEARQRKSHVRCALACAKALQPASGRPRCLNAVESSRSLRQGHGMEQYSAEETSAPRVLRGLLIVRRLMCLFAVSSAGIAGNPEQARDLVTRWKIGASLSPKEASFLSSDIQTASQQIQMSWRIEAMIPLMWSIGMFDEMPPPDDQFDAEYLAGYWNTFSEEDWASVIPRPLHEIQAQADLIRNLHWTMRDARLNGTSTPEGLEAGVVQERRYALNWLACSAQDDWDAITTDT